MNEKSYKIKSILEKYKNNLGKDYLIADKDKINIEFNLSLKRFSHLLGLQYADKNKNEKKIAIEILKNDLNDSDIFKKINKFYPAMIKDVKKRIANIEFALKNLENAKLVKADLPKNSNMKSINFIIQKKDNEYLQIGVGKYSSNEYLLETFIVRNDERYFNSKELNSEILGIYKYDEDYNLIPFSFDTKKQKLLDIAWKNDKENFKYKEVLKDFKNIENTNNIKTSIWENKIGKDKDKGLER